MAWLGPDPDQIRDHFLQFFGASLQCTGDVFCVANSAEVREYLGHMASKRGCALPADLEVEKINLQRIYAPGQLVRLQEYSERKRAAEAADSSSKDGNDGNSNVPARTSFFADLEQNVGSGSSTASELLPSALTHGTVHA